MDRKVSRKDFVKGTLGVLGGIVAQVVSARAALGSKLRAPEPRPRLQTLTVNSLSITPGSEWPVESASGIMSARDKVTYDSRQVDRVTFIGDGASLPSSSTEGTWGGSPSVQTDFSP